MIPFIILSLHDSLTVWSSLYFYGAIGTLASVAFFSSPAKSLFISQLTRRNKPLPVPSPAQEPNNPPTLGLPSDPPREVDDAVKEIRAEIESVRKSGESVAMPSGQELKSAVEGKIGKKL